MIKSLKYAMIYTIETIGKISVCIINDKYLKRLIRFLIISKGKNKSTGQEA